MMVIINRLPYWEDLYFVVVISVSSLGGKEYYFKILRRKNVQNFFICNV